MTAHDGTAPGRQRFVSGNSHLDQLLADPQLAADVAAAQADAEEMDRAGAYYWTRCFRPISRMPSVELGLRRSYASEPQPGSIPPSPWREVPEVRGLGGG